MGIHSLCPGTRLRKLVKPTIDAEEDARMTWHPEDALSETHELAESGGPAQALALADLIKRVRTLRSQAAYHDLDMIAYLLHMAEVEACDKLIRMAEEDPREGRTPCSE